MSIDTKALALDIARAAQDKKGQNLVIIDLTAQSSYADYLVLVSAYSTRQTNGIADGVMTDLRNGQKKRALSKEGVEGWVLVDYGDVVLHVFHEDERAQYNLDGLWKDAPRIPVPVIEAPQIQTGT